jgi:hypothetical protein
MNLRHHSLVAWQRADDLFIRIHITPDVSKQLEKDLNRVGAPLIGLIRSVRLSKDSAST